MCGKSVAVGLVSGSMIQHDDKNAQRCRGTGQMPVVRAPRAASTGGSSAAGTRPAAKKAASPATKGSLSVRRVEVDPDVLRERQERAERLRQERAEAARDRNEVHVSYFDEPGR